MKNYISFRLLLVLMATSCSNEVIDLSNDANSQTAFGYIQKTFNVTVTPNMVIDSTYFVLDNSRIVSSNSVNLETSNQKNSEYIYDNGKISQIESYENNVLSSIQNFTYNSSNQLVEYRSEIINNPNNLINKHLFTHTNDTIFSEWTRSSDGSTFNPIQDSKIVLDGNSNRTYFEAYDYLNDVVTYTNSDYTNNNLVSEQRYEFINPDNAQLMISNTYTYAQGENSLSIINEATFSKKTMMLLYHLQTTAINNYNAKSISNNIISSFSTSFGGGNFYDLDVTNTISDFNLSLETDFSTFISGNLFARFTQEFLYESSLQ